MNELQIKECREMAERIGFDESQVDLVEKCEALIEAAEGDDYDIFIEKLADVRIIIEQIKLTLDDDQQEQYEAAIDSKLNFLTDCCGSDPDDEPF